MGEKIQSLEKLLSDVRLYLKEIRSGRSLEEMLGIGKILSQSLIGAVSADNLEDYWMEIASSHQINPKSALESAHSLIRIHRFAGNIFEVLGDPLPDLFGQCLFFQNLMCSLLKSLEHISPSNRIGLGYIIKDLSIDAIRAIGWSICASHSEGKKLLIEILHYPTLHQILLSLFGMPLVSKSSLSADDVQAIYSVVGLLLQRMNDLTATSPAPTPIPSALFYPLENDAKVQSFLPFMTQRPSTIRMARVIANGIPISGVPLACHRVGLLWSERAFINQGNLEVQNYITAILLTFLPRLTRVDLFTPPEELCSGDGSESRQTLLSILSRGVSVHLDSPTTMTRVNGMRVAERLSELMSSSSEEQTAIQFEELKNYCEDAEGNLIPRHGAELSNQETGPERDAESGGQDERDDSDGDSVSESESDDEFESYFMNEKLAVISDQDPDQRSELMEAKINAIESQEERVPLLRYLRECLSSASPPFILLSLLRHRIAIHRQLQPRWVICEPQGCSGASLSLLSLLLLLANPDPDHLLLSRSASR
jgi:hypothetical protein